MLSSSELRLRGRTAGLADVVGDDEDATDVFLRNHSRQAVGAQEICVAHTDLVTKDVYTRSWMVLLARPFPRSEYRSRLALHGK